MHFFPRVFFLYFTLFHVYFFPCPIGFTYASLASTTLFLFHTMLFFLNRYELPALHSGLITPHIPRMVRLGSYGVEGGRFGGEAAESPPRIHPSYQPMPTTMQHQDPPPIPRVTSLDEPSSHRTAPTAPLTLTSSVDLTPQSGSRLPPMRSYVAAASSSLQSIRSLTSIQSLTSLAAADRSSPNFIFQGGYGFSDSGVGEESEEDSYIARVTSS